MSSYTKNLARPSDIQEHLGLLHGLAMGHSVVEFGFRTGVSTSAFLAAGSHVTSYDIDKASCRPYVKALAKEYPDTFKFYEGDSTKVDLDPFYDVMFLDTDHTYATTLEELRRHHPHITSFIAIHDTVTFAHRDRNSKPGSSGINQGLYSAIRDFQEETKFRPGRYQWSTHLHLRNNNGLTLLRRDGRL